jgi:CBS-domain-containing membrane protein
MHAADIMTPDVVCATPETPLPELIRLMLDRGIGAVPIIEGDKLVGIVSESDLLHRAEVGTEARRPHWLELITSSDRLASEYVKTHGRKAGEIMTHDVITVSDTTPVADIVRLMESHGIKRVPVLRDGKLVGIISRRNLMQAVASRMQTPPASAEDRAIRETFYAKLAAEPWADGSGAINAVVSDGIVHLWGEAPKGAKREAIVVLAESVPGVKGVEDHLEEPRVYDPMDRPNWQNWPGPTRS